MFAFNSKILNDRIRLELIETIDIDSDDREPITIIKSSQDIFFEELDKKMNDWRSAHAR